MPQGLHRAFAGLVRLGLFALCACAAQLQLPPTRRTAVDNIALACCTNLLAALIYITYATARRVVCIPTEPEQKTFVVSNTSPRADGDIHHLTPMMLWYYVYAVGMAIFGLSYALTCTTDLPAFALALATAMCALWNVSLDVPPAAHRCMPRTLFRGILTIGTIIVLLITVDVSKAAADGAWAAALFPLAAPFFLASCRTSVSAARISADRLVLFALPFLAAVSFCYLSLHTPLQRCSVLATSVDAYLNGSTAMDLLKLIELNESTGDTREGIALIAIWLLAAGSVTSAAVVFISGVMRPINTLQCATGFTAVVCARHAILVRSAPTAAAAAVAAMIAVGAIAEHSTQPDYAHDRAATVLEEELDERASFSVTDEA